MFVDPGKNKAKFGERAGDLPRIYGPVYLRPAYFFTPVDLIGAFNTR